MIKLKKIILESTDEYRVDWLDRHNAIIENNRLLAYHGTPKKNLSSIKKNGFRIHTYFSLKEEYSKSIASIYHETPKTNIVVLKVWLPLNAIDFVMSDIYSIRTIKFEEII